MRSLWLCGAGNPEGVRLALRVNEREKRWERIALLDDDPRKHGTSVLGIEIAGPFKLLEGSDPAESELVNLVARTTGIRRRVRERLGAFGLPMASLVHPDVDTLGAELGEAVTIYRGATVSAHSRIGADTVLFAGANAGHGSRLGDGCVLAPGAVVNARVQLGDLCYVGCNASILPDLRIGAGAIIGAGSTVLEDVAPGTTVMGVPARVLLPAESDRSAGATQGVGNVEEFEEPVDMRFEALVTAAWAQTLGLPDLGRTENFFELGGSSLLALRVRERIESATGQRLQATDIYRFPTIRALAAHLARGGTASPAVRAADHRGRMRRHRQGGA